jgi:hypothetical protein
MVHVSVIDITIDVEVAIDGEVAIDVEVAIRAVTTQNLEDQPDQEENPADDGAGQEDLVQG